MRGILILLFLLFLSVIALTDLLSTFHTLLLLSFTLLVYNGIEIFHLRQLKWHNFLINPIVLGVFLVFGVYSGGLSNFYLIKGEWFYIKEPARVLNSETYWLKYFMVLANVAAVFVWFGYYLPVAEGVNKWLQQKLSYSKIFNLEVSKARVVLLVFLGVAAKFYLFSIGLQGRLVSSEFFEAGVGYKLGSQVRILGELLPVVLIVTGYLYLVQKKPDYKYLFYACFTIEVFFGFLYGARGPILIPFFIAFFLNYLADGALRWYHIAVAGVVVLTSFTIVNDFKQYAGQKVFLKNKSSDPFTVLSSFSVYRNVEKGKKESYTKTVEETFLNSTNFVAEGSMAIRHKEKFGLKETDIDFKGELLRAPVDAFLPRFVQTNKNSPSWGYWFKNKVMKYQLKKKWSMGMSLIGNLYLTGGIFMILLGFLVNGIVYRLAFLNLRNGLIGVVIALTLFQTLSQDEVFVNQCINSMRYILIYPWILFFLFRKYT